MTNAAKTFKRIFNELERYLEEYPDKVMIEYKGMLLGVEDMHVERNEGTREKYIVLKADAEDEEDNAV